MAHFDKWMVRAAVFGATAAVIGAAVFWFVMTQPVQVAMVLDRAF